MLLLGQVILIIVLSFIIIIISDGKTMDRIDYFQEKTKVSNAVAGELYQGIATSFPEMSIMFISVVFLSLNPVVGLSSSIGSGVFQFLPVIGVPALFAASALTINKREATRTVSFYIVLLIALYIMIANGTVGWMELGILVLGRAIYTRRSIKKRPKRKEKLSHKHEQPYQTPHHDYFHDDSITSATPPYQRVINTFAQFQHLIPGPGDKHGFLLKYIPVGFILCLLTIGLSVYYLIAITESLAITFDIPLSFLSLTVLATISSLPELATNVPLAKKGGGDQIIGNAVGSNSIDIAISFALMTLIAAGIQNTGSFEIQDLAGIKVAVLGLIAVAILFRSLMAYNKRKINKKHGRILIAAYILYVIVNYFFY